MPDFDDIAKAIQKLSRVRLVVGVPQQNDPRQDSPIGNASLGYIHELGSPARNIPPRPHLVPGVEAALPEIIPLLKQAAQAALAGDESGMQNALAGAGQRGADSVRATIQAGIPPPLQPATVAARVTGRSRRQTEAQRRGIGMRQLAREEIVEGGATPLIDTASYIRALTFVVRNVG